MSDLAKKSTAPNTSNDLMEPCVDRYRNYGYVIWIYALQQSGFRTVLKKKRSSLDPPCIWLDLFPMVHGRSETAMANLVPVPCS